MVISETKPQLKHLSPHS